MWHTVCRQNCLINERDCSTDRRACSGCGIYVEAFLCLLCYHDILTHTPYGLSLSVAACIGKCTIWVHYSKMYAAECSWYCSKPLSASVPLSWASALCTSKHLQTKDQCHSVHDMAAIILCVITVTSTALTAPVVQCRLRLAVCCLQQILLLVDWTSPRSNG